MLRGRVAAQMTHPKGVFARPNCDEASILHEEKIHPPVLGIVYIYINTATVTEYIDCQIYIIYSNTPGGQEFLYHRLHVNSRYGIPPTLPMGLGLRPTVSTTRSNATSQDSSQDWSTLDHSQPGRKKLFLYSGLRTYLYLAVDWSAKSLKELSIFCKNRVGNISGFAHSVNLSRI